MLQRISAEHLLRDGLVHHHINVLRQDGRQTIVALTKLAIQSPQPAGASGLHTIIADVEQV